MLIKVSHECPISILDRAHEFSDYEYCLVHLLDKYPKYYEHYKTAREVYGREVLLDNSIFELGKAFDSDKFEQAALDLKPNMFIVPDVLESSDETIISYANWLTSGRIKNIKESFLTKAIGAVQGKTWDELVRCYRFMSDNADMIAISFDFSYYLTTGRGKTDLEKFSSGRQRFIHQLIDEGIWNWEKPHHLLGCSLAREFRYYVDNNVYNIASCDTSNPIVAALHGMEYDADYGLQTKPKTKLADLIDHDVTKDEMDIIDYNTKMFKKILCR